MKNSVMFKSYGDTVRIIDLSEVKAIYANDESNTSDLHTIRVYFKKDSDTYSFSTSDERDAVLHHICKLINPLEVTYDEQIKLADSDYYNNKKEK